MRLLSLHLKNYQAHVDTYIDFVQGFNVIIGPTDAGKSSIIRALLKLIRDTPAGKGFIHTGQDTCVLTLMFENLGITYTLTRTISSSKNEYQIQKLGEVIQTFTGFGREIPQEILNVLPMALVQLENSETIDLHFTDQYDLPFMISNTGSMRSRLLGRIAGLHVLGKATLVASKDERRIGTEIEHVTKECAQLTDEIAHMPDVPALEMIVKNVQQKIIFIKKLITRSNYLQNALDNLINIKLSGKRLSQEIKNLPQLNINFSELRATTSKFERLNQLRATLNITDKKLTELIVPTAITVDFTKSRKLISQIDRLQQVNDQLTDINSKISGIDLNKYNSEIQNAEHAWQNELKILGVCPTCKQRITQQVHKHGESEEIKR